METYGFAAVALVILTFSLVSAPMRKSWVTAPMIFVFAGWFLGPEISGIVRLSIDANLVTILAELTLIQILFIDAARIDLNVLKEERCIPLRLLTRAFPLTILLGTVVSRFLFGFGWIESAVLGAILAPTDATLGEAVVSHPKVPIRIRQSLNVESGLNDGLAVPAVLLFLSLASAEGQSFSAIYWVNFIGLQLILGPMVGSLVGYFGGKLLLKALEKKWLLPAFEQLAGISIALLSYSFAHLVGGNALGSVFCAGLALGTTARPFCKPLFEFGESYGQIFIFLTFFIFGGTMVWPSLMFVDVNVLLYAVLSLTFVRAVPVVMSLWKMKLQSQTLFFLSWFGPRGTASILFALLLLQQSTMPHMHEIFVTITVTVLLSVFIHGLSSQPLALWLGHRLEGFKSEVPHAPEYKSCSECPTRHR